MSTAAQPPDPIQRGQVPLPSLEQLPDDLDTLKRMIVELVATLQSERRDRDHLWHRLQLLLQRLYGPRRERFHPEQALLFALTGVAEENPPVDHGGAAPAAATETERPAPQRRRRTHGRRRLPENLPRRPLHHELSEAERICRCGQMRVDIGTDVSEQLDWQPGSYFVWQHLLHKYACLSCAGQAARGTSATPEPTAADMATSTPMPEETSVSKTAPAVSAAPAALGPVVVAAAKPAMPIHKGLPGPGLLAHIIVSKYFDHLPLYRQEKIFERQGVVLARSTTCDWMAACADLLRPLYEKMVAAVLQSRWLHTDDTSVKNLGHEPGATATAHFWIYWGDREHPYNVFDFTVNRKRDGPQTFLAGFSGYLHADAFSGYDALYLPAPGAGMAPIKEVACNAHTRRKFYEARGSDAVRSHQALAYYAQLYALERSAAENHFDDGQRRQMRQDLALPILDKFRRWLEAERVQVLPKSPMAEAIGYALNNWAALSRYTEAGFLSIDNNLAEREMKRIAIGRKNWLFVGSDKGGRTAAVLYSFTSTCQRLGIEPWAYLQDLLGCLPRMPTDQLAELLPDRWQAAREQAGPANPNSAPV